MGSTEPSFSDAGATPPDGYVLHPLATLDGILIYVTMRGEHVGTYFGKTEQAASAAVATDLAERAGATS